jgi:hypothetical protein
VCFASSRASAQEPPQKNVARIHAVFIDSAGSPVAGVEFVNNSWDAELSTTSDDQGRIESRIEWPWRMGDMTCEAYARRHGYALWQLRTNVKAGVDVDLGRITLQPGGTLIGRVLDHDGKPLAGASVSAFDDAVAARPIWFDKQVGASGEGFVDSAITKADGSFLILSVAPGRYWMVAKHDSTLCDATATIHVAAREDVVVPELRLDPLPASMRIEGIVLAPDGERVGGATVSTSVPDGHDTGIDVSFAIMCTAHTNERGEFVLYLAVPPSELLDVYAGTEDKRFDTVRVEHVMGGERGLILRLGAMRDLRLLVRDANGKPVETYGVMMNLRNQRGLRTMTEDVVHRPDGRATFRVPDATLTLEVNAPGYNRASFRTLPAGPLPELVEIALDAPSGVQGTVLAAGAPVAGSHVELVTRDVDHLRGVIGQRWSGVYHGAYHSGTSDSQGRFMIPSDFPRTTYYVRAWKDGYAEGIAGPVQAGSAPVVVELKSGGALEGRVSLPNSKSPTGIVVELYRSDDWLTAAEGHGGFSARLDSDGKYRFEHLAAGPWFLRVKIGDEIASGLRWDAQRVESYIKYPYVVSIEEGGTTRRDLDLVQDDLCRLDGRLTIGDRIREGYAYLLLEGPIALQYPIGSVERDGSGVFHLATRDPGRYRCVVHAGPGRNLDKIVTDLVELRAGANTWQRDVPITSWVGNGIRLDAK